jgi:uncharacterized oxidoreductase
MNLTGNTVLITGGGSGIGRALARELLHRNNTVIVCGRNEAALKQVQADNPGLHTRVADISNVSERKALAHWVVDHFPDLNVVVNNAGIQREFRVDTPDVAVDFERENEIETNVVAPMHLTFLLVPQLLKQNRAAIVNVSSALGLIPIATMPVYCATKAAVQSFSKSLRYQLRPTAIKVFDVAPPQVDTDLDKQLRANRGQTEVGISPERVAAETLRGMAKDHYDIDVGMTRMLRIASRVAPSRMLKTINTAAES